VPLQATRRAAVTRGAAARHTDWPNKPLLSTETPGAPIETLALSGASPYQRITFHLSLFTFDAPDTAPLQRDRIPVLGISGLKFEPLNSLFGKMVQLVIS
jgi:hypothetical protein